jgi:hypothetical protein
MLALAEESVDDFFREFREASGAAAMVPAKTGADVAREVFSGLVGCGDEGEGERFSSSC